MDIQIQVAQAEHLPALVALLTRNQLLGDDLPADLANFWLAFDGDQLIGSVGVDVYGNVGLLRSVSVDARYRNQSIARQLCEIAFRETRQRGITELYLITTTADRYFKGLDFVPVARNTVPEAILQTAQFSSLCPSSAVVMKQTSKS